MRSTTGLILAFAVVGSISLFVVADQGSHSVSDTLYAWVGRAWLLWVATGAAISLVRRRER